MKKTITRRDFLNGVALSATAMALSHPARSLGETSGASRVAAGVSADYYPPLLTGMRGSHKGSFEVAHALAMHGERPSEFERVEEDYDLVVVGGGISGLAAAYLYRKQAGADARILILDNHDDFGGHAKRNEFEVDGKKLLSFGGSINLEQAAMSAQAYQLLEELGVEFQALQDAGPDDYALSNSAAPYGMYLGGELYADDRIVAGPWGEVWAGAGDFRPLIDALELPEKDRDGLLSLVAGDRDYLADIPLQDKDRYLRSTSYGRFLSERVGLSPAGARLVEPWVRALFGVGIESASVREMLAIGAPGLNALGLPDSVTQQAAEVDPNVYRNPMFPDGNASVARLFVRKLIPEVAPGTTMQDLVTARFDYAQLDKEGAPVRLRLNSTAVKVTNLGEDAVEVGYVSGGRALKVRGRNCILAGYNGMVPHLCPEIPDAQKESLAYGVKAPFIWANVALRNGAAVKEGGASVYQCPGSFFELLAHAPPVALGTYDPAGRGQDPMVFFMGHVPSPAGNGSQSARDLYRAGRHRLLTTPFSEYEKAIREQLTGMFGRYGFDADRDIDAITVNRWSHGYAYEYMDLHDPDWDAGQAPHELGRKRFGRISIANSDSEAHAYVQAAIDAAFRAVAEVLA